jgi:hypothetical protein
MWPQDIISEGYTMFRTGDGIQELEEMSFVVMGGFGSEPRFEPEPVRTEPKFSPGFESSQEPNLRFSSWFSSPLNFLNAFELEPSTIIVITNI